MCNGVDTIPQESVPYDNQGSDLYNDIFLYHITLCRSSVRGFSFAIDPMGFRAQWAHTTTKVNILVAEKILSTFIHLLMWFMLII